MTPKPDSALSECLLPCPYCGSVNISSGEILSGCDPSKGLFHRQTACMNCGAAGPEVKVSKPTDGDEEADAAWNRRTPPAVGAVDALREFKNFHKQLCERFDYLHDENDWQRDQVSLIEFIAKHFTHPLSAGQEAVAIPVVSVIAAVRSAEAENGRRGEMYPQTADEHREDRAAARRTIGTLEFLGKSAESLSDWPKLATRPPTPPAVDGDVVRDALKYRDLATPEIKDFLLAVEREALHQRERWAVDHDAGKTATDWLWLIAFLSTKATQADRYGEPDKYLHHIITTAAACLNWHAHAIGADTRMRPSADPLGGNGAAIRAQKEGK